jgi:hypothetical protein
MRSSASELKKNASCRTSFRAPLDVSEERHRRKRGKASMEQFEVQTMVKEARKFGKCIMNLPAPSAIISPIPKATRKQQSRETKTKLQEATCVKGKVFLEYDLPSRTNAYSGRIYTPSESVMLMKRLPSGKERAALVNEWVRLELIPCQPRQIRSYLHKLRACLLRRPTTAMNLQRLLHSEN